MLQIQFTPELFVTLCMEKEFKIMSVVELAKLIGAIEKDNLSSAKELLQYIGELESNLSTYQMALEQIQYCINSHNVNVVR